MDDKTAIQKLGAGWYNGSNPSYQIYYSGEGNRPPQMAKNLNARQTAHVYDATYPNVPDFATWQRRMQWTIVAGYPVGMSVYTEELTYYGGKHLGHIIGLDGYSDSGATVQVVDPNDCSPNAQGVYVGGHHPVPAQEVHDAMMARPDGWEVWIW